MFCSYSDKFTRFCQWKNVELNIHVSWPVGMKDCAPSLLPSLEGQAPRLGWGRGGPGSLPFSP